MIVAMEFIEDEILALSQPGCLIRVYSMRIFIVFFSVFLNSAKKEIVPENNTVAM